MSEVHPKPGAFSIACGALAVVGLYMAALAPQPWAWVGAFLASLLCFAVGADYGRRYIAANRLKKCVCNGPEADS